MGNDFQQCLEKAIDYLSRRDHSSKELRDKLNKKKFDKELIEKTLEWVTERGYLRPPHELSKSLSELLSKKGKGRLYILQYLKKRGLPPPENLDFESELNNALELALRILKQKNIQREAQLDRLAREKIGRKLMSRGFPLDIVRKVIYEKINLD
jgi:regulatory protein